MKNKKFFWIPIVAVAAFFGLSWVVMALWNYIFPAIAPLNPIDYKHAMALLILCKILFGGFKGGGGGWKHKGNLNAMSDEDKARMKEYWEAKCKRRGE